MAELLRRLNGVHPLRMGAVTSQVLTGLAGVVDARVLLLDPAGELLRPFGDEPGADDVSVAGTTTGSALSTPDPVLEQVTKTRTLIHLAMRVRAETIGVLTVTCQAESPAGAFLTADTLAALDDAALEVAYVLAGAGDWSDHVEIARRAQPMSLPAELQWSNLPLHALQGAGFAVAGKLLPTYEVGGDLFDMSWGDRGPWVSVVDAVGHGLRSSLLASAAVGSIRHARRSGLGLGEQAEIADRTLLEQWDGLNFVTAVLAEFDIAAGVVRWVNAGHPAPALLRDGKLQELNRPPQSPLGLLCPTSYLVHEQEVRPGDRLVVVSDGMVEAHRKGDPNGPLGLHRLHGALLAAATHSLAGVVHDAVKLVEDWTSGQPRDDATIVVLDVLDVLPTADRLD